MEEGTVKKKWLCYYRPCISFPYPKNLVLSCGFNALPSACENVTASSVKSFNQVRSLEAQGVPSKQAEAITSAITEVLNDSLEIISESFVSKAEMQRLKMLQDSNLSKFKSEVKSSQIASKGSGKSRKKQKISSLLR